MQLAGGASPLLPLEEALVELVELVDEELAASGRPLRALRLWISAGSTQADSEFSGAGIPRPVGDLPEI